MAIFQLLLFVAGAAAQAPTPKGEILPWHFVDQGTVPAPSADMPGYAALLYGESVDLGELEDAWLEHYRGQDRDAPMEDLERDPYAKYFHTWLQGAQDFADEAGIVRRLSTKDLVSRRRSLARLSAAPKTNSDALQRGGGSRSWSFVGPKKTLWLGGNGAPERVAPWQVNIYCIAAAPSQPTTLFCGGETGALYKSVDQGLEWIPQDSMNWGGAIFSVAIHPTQPDTVYCGTNRDIFKSTDGGLNWAIVFTESGLSCNSLVFDPEFPETVYAGAGTGLWVTRDGGSTWTQALTERVDDVEVAPGDGSTVYANVRSGTPDGWTFYVSSDRGQTFTVSMNGWGNLFEHSGSRLAVSPADPDRVYALLITRDATGDNRGVTLLRSDDRSATWSTVATGPSDELALGSGQGYYDLDIAISAVNADHVLAATTTAYRSVDGGQTWSAVGGYGGPFGIHPDIQAMISVPNGNGLDTWIATDGGVNYSSDFFQDVDNWSPRIEGLDGTDFWGYGQGWNEDFGVGGRYHNGNTALSPDYPERRALRLGGAESATGWALHGRERHVAFDDINNIILPRAVDEAPSGTFAFTKHPNIHFYGDAFSRVMVDLEDFHTIYVGEGNSFWRSVDGGIQWQALHTFTGRPFHFDISRADPNRIYLATTTGLFVSSHRGLSFEERALPPGLGSWHSQNLRIAASSTNPDVAWVLNQRSGSDSSTGRIFRTDDGGLSWSDLTTPAFAGRKWTSMAHPIGSGGGIYVASRRGAPGTNPARVLYLDDALPDWIDQSEGLPPSANPIKLLPFYPGGKLRWIGNRGVWEIDLHTSDWAPKARPFVDGTYRPCVRDVVEFDSYSAVKSTATYSWSIPSAAWTSPLDQRQVNALFPRPGLYTATLTVTQGGLSDAESVSIFVGDECSPTPYRGNALALAGGTGDYAVSNEPLELTTNTLTLSGWIKREGEQPGYAGILFSRGSSSAGLNMRDGAQLGFHWGNSQWAWESGLFLPESEWAHVAMVVEPTGVTLYLNGTPSHRPFTAAPYTFDAPIYLGADRNWNARRFRGEMDEWLVHDRALGREEILQEMHLTRDVENEQGLVAYWQFNRASGTVTDVKGTHHLGLAGAAARRPSTAPVGPGVSAVRTVSGQGSYDFGQTGVTLDFDTGATSLDGDIWITRVDDLPHLPPRGDVSPSHWFVHYTGTGSALGDLQRASLAQDFAPEFTRFPGTVKLYQRGENLHGSTWGRAQQTATMVDPSGATFTLGPWAEGQWILGWRAIEAEPNVAPGG